jgi:hypothetical protein
MVTLADPRDWVPSQKRRVGPPKLLPSLNTRRNVCATTILSGIKVQGTTLKSLRIIAGVLLLIASATNLHAAAALFLEEPFGNFGEMNPTGHAAIYLSNVCADSPTVLRHCRPGEMGVVISRYHHVAGYDWIAMPLIPYLYAVENPSQVPDSVDSHQVAQLRDSYRRQHLSVLIADGPEGATPGGEWIQLVGSSYDRKIYAFEIESSDEQDDRVITMLNSSRNKSRFNLFFRNCADFSGHTLNTYYPNAVHRSLIADAGITTPKEIAKTLAAYSKHHSDLWFTEYEIPQVPGSVRRSHAVRGVCESLLRSKKYAVPLIALHPWIGASVGVAYVTRGLFNPERHAIKLEDPFEVERRLTEGDPMHRSGSTEPSEDEGIALASDAQSSSPAALPNPVNRLH